MHIIYSYLRKIFFTFSLYLVPFSILAQSRLIEKHNQWEQDIEWNYPNLDKKNADGSYSLHLKVSGSELDDYLDAMSLAYGQGASFSDKDIENGLSCDRTITVSKTKIIVKLHDVLMLTPDISEDEEMGDGSKMPSDPYIQFLGCKGGTRMIKNGGLVLGVPEDDERYNDYIYNEYYQLTLISGKGNSTCSHSSKRIPVTFGATTVYRKNQNQHITKGGIRDAASDFLSPYRFDHHHTVVYNLIEIAEQNGITLDQLVRLLLENALWKIVVGDNGAALSLTSCEIHYIQRFLWRLYGYSESKLNIEYEERRKRLEADNQHWQKELHDTMNEELKNMVTKASEIQKMMVTDPILAYNRCLVILNSCNELFQRATAQNDNDIASKVKFNYGQFMILKCECCFEKLLSGYISEEEFHYEHGHLKSFVDDVGYGQMNYQIAGTCMREEKYKEAIDYFDIAMTYYQKEDYLKKDLHSLLTYQAFCYGKLLNEKKAFATIERAIELAPEDYLPYDSKGVIFICLNQKKKAKAYWKNVVLPKFGNVAKSGRFYKDLKEFGLIDE